MKEKTARNYFSIIKIMYTLIVLILYFINSNEINNIRLGFELCIYILLISALLLTDIVEKRLYTITVSLVLSLILCIVFNSSYVAVLIVPLMDIILFFKLPLWCYLLDFIFLLIPHIDLRMFVLSCFFIDSLYIQYNFVIIYYEHLLHSLTESEANLKESIYRQNVVHKMNENKKRLEYENKILEERNILSQNLHDKLGHSINGSIFQLEAAKLLINKDKDKTNEIMQAVIDTLRTSLDEIRAILRKKKPMQSELSFMKIWKLCNEMDNKYNINTEFICSGEKDKVKSFVWDVILSNATEACSNALKYADCKNMVIKVDVLNKMVRCSISNDGRGCVSVKKGMGLRGMEERLNDIGGIMSIDAEYGFSINMIIPI